MDEFEIKYKFLEKHVYHGLKNLNTGWDAPSILYFSEDDFRIVLNRVKRLGLGIKGIEPWDMDNHYFDTKVFEEYTTVSTDADWYNKAFIEFIKTGEKLQYSASYYVPEELLKM